MRMGEPRCSGGEHGLLCCKCPTCERASASERRERQRAPVRSSSKRSEPLCVASASLAAPVCASQSQLNMRAREACEHGKHTGTGRTRAHKEHASTIQFTTVDWLVDARSWYGDTEFALTRFHRSSLRCACWSFAQGLAGARDAHSLTLAHRRSPVRCAHRFALARFRAFSISIRFLAISRCFPNSPPTLQFTPSSIATRFSVTS